VAHEGVQRQACLLLSLLAGVAPGGCSKVDAIGGIRIATVAIAEHSEVPDVLEAAAALLVTLSAEPAALLTVVNAGAVRAVAHD
jgi:hypothetical protein